MRGSKNIIGRLITSLICGLFMAGSAFAIPVTFNLRDITAAADIEDGSITRDGLTASLTVLVSGNSGTLNQTTTSFGVDATNNGIPNDQSALVDGIDGAESISLVFGFDVLFLGANISAFSGTEQALLSIGGSPSISLSDTGAATDAYSFTANNFVPLGSTVTLAWVAGNGFSFDSFTVEQWVRPVDPVNEPGSAVPDAGATLALLGLSLTGLGLLARRRS